MSLKLDGEGDSAEDTSLTEPDLSKCGINYCPAVSAPGNETADEADNFSATNYQLYILAGVFLACSICSAVTVALFVDPLSK